MNVFFPFLSLQITDPVAFQKMLADMKAKAEEQRWVVCLGLSALDCEFIRLLRVYSMLPNLLITSPKSTPFIT